MQFRMRPIVSVLLFSFPVLILLFAYSLSGCRTTDAATEPVRATVAPGKRSHTTSFVVFPKDANANPPMLFGGRILEEMDRCAAIAVRRLLHDSPTGVRDAVTVAIEKATFRKPGRVKDLILVTATVEEVGAKSIRLSVRVEREEPGSPTRELVADAVFVFCSFDLEKGKAVEHGVVLGDD